MPRTTLCTDGSSLVGDQLHEIWNYKRDLYPLECLVRQLLINRFPSPKVVPDAFLINFQGTLLQGWGAHWENNCCAPSTMFFELKNKCKRYMFM